MTTTRGFETKDLTTIGKSTEDLFIILCATGFENVERVRSALMFATLAASANYKPVLFCIQSAVDILTKGSIEKHERPKPSVPTLAQRLNEALEMGVEIQCCSQSMANKKVTEDNLIPGVKIAGAMNLLILSTKARGTLCF